MADKKSFLLRMDAAMLEALKKLADDEFRSLNGQIEYMLREGLRSRGRFQTDPKQDEER